MRVHRRWKDGFAVRIPQGMEWRERGTQLQIVFYRAGDEIQEFVTEKVKGKGRPGSQVESASRYWWLTQSCGEREGGWCLQSFQGVETEWPLWVVCCR